MLKFRWVTGLYLILLLWVGGQGYAASGDSIRIERLRVEADGVQRGIRGVLATFDLQLTRPMDGEIPVFHSDWGPYLIRSFITDPNGLPIAGTDDAPNYRNKMGHCRDSIRFIVPEKGELFPDFQLFIPFYALDLRSGTYDLRLKLEMRHAETGALIQVTDPIPIAINKPALKLLRMSVKYFSVDSFDLSGGNWDYHLLNEDESRPDPEWKLMRGRFPVHKPRKLKNTYEYEGESLDLTPVFTLSEGDLLDVRVEDFDLTSFSDQIGSTTLNPWRDNFQLATYQKRSFAKVKDFTFSLFGVYLPELEIGKIRTEVNSVFEGVTGTSVSWEYRVMGKPDASRFFIELQHTLGAQEEIPQFMRVKSGQGHLDDAQHLILDADSGTVSLFIPHYGITQPSSAIPSFLRLAARLTMDGQNFTLMERVQRLPNLFTDKDLADIRFLSYSADIDKQGSHAGFRVVCELEIPAMYGEDVADREYRFRPGIQLPSGPVDPAWVEYQENGPGRVAGPELLLDPTPGLKRIEMFIPAYHFSPLPKGNVPVRLNATVRMGREDEEWILGSAQTTMNLTLPTPDSVVMKVAMVQAKRYPWMKDGANLMWRLRSGNIVLFESPVVYNDFSPQWDQDLRATLELYGNMEDVRLEIVHLGRGRMEHLLGILKRGSDEWPVDAGPVRQKVKMPGLKKCVVEIRDGKGF